MASEDSMWFLTKWLWQLGIVNSDSDAQTKKRKRTEGLPMASGYDEESDGELKRIIQANGGIVVYSCNEDFQESKIARRSQDLTKFKSSQDTFDMLFIHGSVTETKS